jgi:hypothetical protein
VNLSAAATPGAVAAGFVAAVRRAWIPRGLLRALPRIAALVARMMALAWIVSPYAE